MSKKKPAYEVYTLDNTVIVHADSLQQAIDIVASDDDEEDVIGAIELSLFHKSAVQRPDLI